MNKVLKKSLIAFSILAILIVSAGVTTFLVIKLTHRVVPFDLSDAPAEILLIRDQLLDDLGNDTFEWSDMADFVIFSQYVANNSPEILELVSDWEEIVLFNITDEINNLWFLIVDNSLQVEIGDNPPTEYGILIELDFATMIRIIKQEVSPLKAFQQGDLKYDGKFDEVLVVNQIVEIAAATLNGTYTPPTDITDNFVITADDRAKYTTGGLTILPYFQVDIDPNKVGELHASRIGTGKVIIVDSEGKIVGELQNSAHSVHKFINSTTVAMGGQEGNMELWNYQTDSLQLLDVPGGHHDFDYNPETDTFMVLEYSMSSEIWDGWTILYDKLAEYSRDGELIWEWEGQDYFPFNSTRHTSIGFNATFYGGADWMHASSFVWDKEEDSIYLSVRNLDTILKIDYSTKEVIWDAGKMTNFTFYDINGEIKESLWYHPHSLEMLGENRFIIYDNDLYNTSNPDTMTIENSQGDSRFLEFEIDESTKSIREKWSWTPSNGSYYLPESGGDADRLPDGNTLGIFGNKALVLNLYDTSLITEVSKSGEIVWELSISGVDLTYFWIHRLERFYEGPLINVEESTIDLENGEINLNITTWNSYKIDAKTNGSIKVLVDRKVVFQDDYFFLPQWQPNNMLISLQNIKSNAKRIEIVVENQDGIQTVKSL
ncbi:MAG: aryl-sulfate sulfotransferase, partial [Candidatus Heimdallarchaeota archaeon]|nr:aryl-sulfate sulfotransferase [Candidatus Heimdallarchaeota archaeon]MCK4876539.1 aryl-sulfate sulfotransferase [Candidatus Heimdallarchaeota archaeon]